MSMKLLRREFLMGLGLATVLASDKTVQYSCRYLAGSLTL